MKKVLYSIIFLSIISSIFFVFLNINSEVDDNSDLLAVAIRKRQTTANKIHEDIQKVNLDTSNYVSTNRFNCSSGSCSASSFNTIGLLSYKEYTDAGGNYSYLRSNDSFFVLNRTSNVEHINILNFNHLNDQNDGDSTSNIKVTAYLKSGVKVLGSGTYSDPYVISE